MRGLRHGSGQKLPVGTTLWVETYLGEAKFGLFGDFKIFAKYHMIRRGFQYIYWRGVEIL